MVQVVEELDEQFDAVFSAGHVCRLHILAILSAGGDDVFQLLVLHAVAIGQDGCAAGVEALGREPVAIQVHRHAKRHDQRTVNHLVLRERPVRGHGAIRRRRRKGY